MSLSFLPADIKEALDNLNFNYITEIRLRRGQTVTVEYKGKYSYINAFGISDNRRGAITAGEIEPILNSATGGSVYSYVEQIKNGFITVGHGIRIGIAGEYVTQNGQVQTIKNLTSLNVRIPHNVEGCANYLVTNLFAESLHSTLLFSKPGLGKTTMLRDIALSLSNRGVNNILIFDERNEIAAINCSGNGFNLGDKVDVVRCNNKKNAIASAVRAMKPQIIITDELYGEDDISAMRYAADCGIYVIASSHICNKALLKTMPFEYYAELVGIGLPPKIYDKNFNSYCSGNSDNVDRTLSVGK